ncbi:MAG: hypothetical protein P8Y67_12450 [Alphaproteobacteria bacterium]
MHYIKAGRAEGRVPHPPGNQRKAGNLMGGVRRLLQDKRYRKYASSRLVLSVEPILPQHFAERMRRRIDKNAPLGDHAVEVSVRVKASVRQRSCESHYPFSPPRNTLRVVVIAWDVGHNPVGRASLLAEALSRDFYVTLIGPQFPSYGSAVWKPIRNSLVPIITFPGTDYPDFAGKLSDIASRLDCDAIVACKPRLPSLHLGLLAKQAHNCPLIIDIDDYELSFCNIKDLSANLSTIDDYTNKDEIHTPYSDLAVLLFLTHVMEPSSIPTFTIVKLAEKSLVSPLPRRLFCSLVQ